MWHFHAEHPPNLRPNILHDLVSPVEGETASGNNVRQKAINTKTLHPLYQVMIATLRQTNLKLEFSPYLQQQRMKNRKVPIVLYMGMKFIPIMPGSRV
jgi:hypothetical protein